MRRTLRILHPDTWMQADQHISALSGFPIFFRCLALTFTWFHLVNSDESHKFVSRMSRILLSGSVFIAFCMSHDFPFPRTFLPMVGSLEGSKVEVSWTNFVTHWCRQVETSRMRMCQRLGVIQNPEYQCWSSFPLSLSFFCIYV